MRKIPLALRADMERDPFYKRCAISGKPIGMVKIEWHHNLIYAGRQVNEKWCIIPLSKEIHDNIVRYKEEVDWIMLNRASDEELMRYSRAELITKRERLNKKFGIWQKK